MDTVKSLFSPFTGASNPLQDTLVWLLASLWLHCSQYVLGRNSSSSEGPLRRLGAFQCLRGMGSLIVSELSPACWCVDERSSAFFLTAHFSQEDYPYDWYVNCDWPDECMMLTSNHARKVDALAGEGTSHEARGVRQCPK